MTVARQAHAPSQESSEGIAGQNGIGSRARLVVSTGAVDLARGNPGQA
jgi:hypothetical protein